MFRIISDILNTQQNQKISKPADKTADTSIDLEKANQSQSIDDEAKKLGYRKTAIPNVYTDKKGGFVIWNHNKFVFEKTSAGKVFAIKNGYSETKNPDLFYNEAENKYYQWTGRKFYELKNFKDINEFGAYTLSDGRTTQTVDTQGNFRLAWDNEIRHYDCRGKKLDETAIKQFEARVAGYVETESSKIYCDKTGTNYYQWNVKTKTFDSIRNPNLPPEETITETLDTKTVTMQPLDGNFENFKQGQKGDCWLLSTLYGIKKAHPDYKFTTPDGNGNVTVELKGAEKSYVITKEELDNAIAQKESSIFYDKTNVYAAGDKDIVAIELAVEKFRKETLENNNDSRNFYNVNYIASHSDYNYLYGGTHYNAILLLTGKDSDIIQPTRTSNNKEIDENIVRIDTIIDLQNPKTLIEEKINNPNLIKLASLNLNDVPHGVVITRQDEENVYIVDPDNTYEGEQPIKKGEFYNMLIAITTTGLNKAPEDYAKQNEKIFTGMTQKAKEYLLEKNNN